MEGGQYWTLSHAFFANMGYLQHLPVLPLDAIALAYSACSVITSTLWWYKSQGCQVPVIITMKQKGLNASEKEKKETMEELRKRAELSFFAETKRQDLRFPIPNDADFDFRFWNSEYDDASYIDAGILFSGLVFGAVHVLAWSFPFKTVTERRLWKVFTTITAAAVPVLVILSSIISKLSGRNHGEDSISSRESQVRFL